MALCTLLSFGAMCSQDDERVLQSWKSSLWKGLWDSRPYVFNQYNVLQTAHDFLLENSDMLKHWKLQNLKLAFLNTDRNNIFSPKSSEIFRIRDCHPTALKGTIGHLLFATSTETAGRVISTWLEEEGVQSPVLRSSWFMLWWAIRDESQMQKCDVKRGWNLFILSIKWWQLFIKCFRQNGKLKTWAQTVA